MFEIKKTLNIRSFVCSFVRLQCPDSQSKKDLDAYMQRIALYCHQLNITSKVKADVQNVSGELIVCGVRFTCLVVLSRGEGALTVVSVFITVPG